MVNVNPQTALELGIGQSVDLPGSQRADKKNWTVAPYNRWTFQRVQQFTATTRSPRAKNPSPLPQQFQDLTGIEFTDSRNHSCSIADLLARTWTDGFMALHKGQVITEQYFNGMDSSTLHLLMSCSKSFTSTLAGIFIQKGQINLSEKVEHYIPELKGSGFEGATIQQLLDMRVGIKYSEDYHDLEADWRKSEVATGWRQPDKNYKGPLDMITYAKGLGSEGGHGGTFHYQSIITDMIGCVIERVTGRRFADLFSEYIWEPMGAEQDLVSIIDSAGNAVFEGGFNICLRDFARFGNLLCHNGSYKDQSMVPPEWIQDCRHPNQELIKAFEMSEYGEVLPGGAYHNQFWVKDPAKGIFMALGVHGQTLYMDPENQIVIAKMSSQPEMADITMVLDQILAFETITKHLCEQ